MVKHYVSNNIDPNDKTGSVINMMAPAAISTLFGGGVLGIFLGLAMRVFHIDTAGILRSIWQSLKELLTTHKQVRPEEVHSIVENAVQEHTTPATEQEAQEGIQQMELMKKNHFLRDEHLLKLGASRGFSWFSAKKSQTSSVLTRVLSVVFRMILASAGLMVAGDLINKMLGRPNALDDTVQKGKPVSETSVPTSKQTKFKPNPSFQESPKNVGSSSWAENITNNRGDIEQMLLNFAKQVYQGLSGQEAAIQSSPTFQHLVDAITWYNHTSSGGPVVFIPRTFTTKRQLVDSFIDEVAAKAT